MEKYLLSLPELMKNGIRNRPDKTLSRKDCNVEPSNGKAPQTSTYSTTPSDCGGKNVIKIILTFTVYDSPKCQFLAQCTFCPRKLLARHTVAIL